MDREARIAQARLEHALYHSGCVITHNPKSRPIKVCHDPCHRRNQ